MTIETNSALRRLGTVVPRAIALAILIVACRDSTPARPRTTLSVPDAIEAQLIFSNLTPRAGEEVVARVRVQTGAGVKPIGSFTARIAYDTLALAFIEEEPLASVGMRVVNPAPGEARVAGISTTGFENGELVALRFMARRAGSISSTSATLEEMHSVDRDDLLHTITSRRVSAQPLAQ